MFGTTSTRESEPAAPATRPSVPSKLSYAPLKEDSDKLDLIRKRLLEQRRTRDDFQAQFRSRAKPADIPDDLIDQVDLEQALDAHLGGISESTIRDAQYRVTALEAAEREQAKRVRQCHGCACEFVAESLRPYYAGLQARQGAALAVFWQLVDEELVFLHDLQTQGIDMPGDYLNTLFGRKLTNESIAEWRRHAREWHNIDLLT